ncbi:MAG: carboxypeptidase-like regulatory domain-containing protein [Bacteroidota bacterium]
MKFQISARLSIVIFLLISMSLIFTNCGDDDVTEPPPPTYTKIVVKSSTDSTVIVGANVVLYNADNGESITRELSGDDGIAEFENLASGTYYAEISANGFMQIPPKQVNPIPFSVSSTENFKQTYYLAKLEGTFGKIDGNIEPNMAGFLVIAHSAGSDAEYHTYSGPDGYFVIFNIPFGDYVVDAIKSGYQSTNQPEVSLTSSSSSATADITLNTITGSTLNGMVTFLAVYNGIVDVSLLDNKSLSVVNGLTTVIDSNRVYSIENIPAGDYKAWASYENDGYVMDPDWIFKNPGALNISFETDTTKELDFSVTGAITIISPSNPFDAIIPDTVEVDSLTFSWEAYPQSKEYIIEVRDINGNLVWGGFSESGEIYHDKITKENISVEFNFDGSAVEELKSGNIYQWKIYSDDDAQQGIQRLLSSSEDLMGIFFVK